MKAAYPDSCCFLYYGASELSYVTWLTDQEMNDNPACIGKPFPGVDVTLCNGEIYVDTPYSAIGITGPYSVGDTGYMDRDGYLYFNGRKDNVYNIHGNKVSAVKIENALNSLPQVQEAAVIFENNALRAHVVLPVPTPSGQDAAALRRIIKKELKDYLESWEIPRDIVFHENLPKNNSGKTVRGLLSPQIRDQEVADEDMGVLPIYMGVKGEENAGLTVSFLYFAMNKNASEKDQKATKQFLDYILNDDEARDIITNEAGFETPFKSYAKAGYQTKNPIHRANDAYAKADKYDIVIYPLPSTQWVLTLGNAMLEYAQETGTWDTVHDAFVDGWASEYKTTH